MRLSVVLLSLLLNVKPSPVKVAVIDTGLKRGSKVKLCKLGHKDVTDKGIEDIHGHGTNVAGLIEQYAEDADYCQMTIKYYHHTSKYDFTIPDTISSFKQAINMKADVIVYASTGTEYNEGEKAIVKQALDLGIIVVVPSGNSSVDLDKECKVYPACYDDRLAVVNRSDLLSKENPKHGYGSVVKFSENGDNQTALGITMSGTSQATAIAAGKLIKELYNARKPKP